MALWYQCDASTWWWWSYVADLGPYDGTLPLPRPIWLPNEAAEIDYVVGIPHPSGDPRRFRDGSYSAGGFGGSYAYVSTPGVISGGGTYGGLSAPEPQDHLFIQFYRTGYPSSPTLPPPKPGLAYVPSTLIAGGYGPTMGEGGLEFHCPGGARPRVTISEGHWSDWQPPFEALYDVEISSLAYQARQAFVDNAPGSPDTATMMDSVQSTLKAGGGSDASADFSALFEAFADMTSEARSFHGYNSATFRGSEVVGVLQDPGNINDFPHTDIPVGLRDSLTSPDAQVQFQSAPTFIGWQDWTVSALKMFIQSRANEEPFWTPPTIFPLTVGYCDPISEGTLTGHANSRPVHVGPDLVYSDVTWLDELDVDITPPFTSYSPFTGPDWVQTENSFDFPVSLSGISALDFSLVLMSRWAGPDTFTIPALAGTNSLRLSVSFGQLFEPVFYAGFAALGFIARMHKQMSSWRYWIPGDTNVQCTTPILRLNQRNDGRGSSRHPRLLSSTSAPSSRQRSAAPRLGSNGHYL